MRDDIGMQEVLRDQTWAQKKGELPGGGETDAEL